jgi:recombinational DNA repair ATPase RecF
MRVQSISLTWFRGSADTVQLDLGAKSGVIYGENGAGKSTFVDAIEYLLHDGRIGHLSHEYSGKHQEKGVINTHAPADKKAELSIALGDGTSVKATIDHRGTAIVAGNGEAEIRTWDYGRTVLRQDEVAAFIRDTKGAKYSAILPLLGLRSMESLAENTRQLAKAVEQRSNLREGLGKTQALLAKRVEVFGESSDEALDTRVCGLHDTYCPSETASEPVSQCQGIKAAIADRMARYSNDQRHHAVLVGISSIQLKPLIDSVRLANSALIETIEPLFEKLEVLRTAGQFAKTLQGEQEVECPACGRSVSPSEFREHVQAESERLQESMQALQRRKHATEALVDALKSLRSILSTPEGRAWLTQEQLEPAGAFIDAINLSHVQDSPSDSELVRIDEELSPLIAKAVEAAKQTPPDVQDLSRDGRLIELLAEIVGGRMLAAQLVRAASLKAFLQKFESGIREEIKNESQRVINELSTTIQSMWATLHPGEAIEGVRLYIPDGADKAIDIELKFFGVEQPSPRLTLSEGYRNSLGLCIFLAMAKRDAASDRPLFLDDVVVSLDRNHRGMIVELLEKEFPDRQVVIFTHDRDWYAELSQQLDSKSWSFRALLPFEKPDLGIRWSATTSTFGDARAFLQAAPHAAGNTARKIMDTELALRADRLNVRLPFRLSTKNDRRTAHDFLFQLIADGPQCFQKEGPKGFEPHVDAIEAWKAADKLLMTWGNKASHTMDMVRPEAVKLINACETALEAFKCKDCNKPVYKLDDDKAELTQCKCGHLRWRYGKA